MIHSGFNYIFPFIQCHIFKNIMYRSLSFTDCFHFCPINKQTGNTYVTIHRYGSHFILTLSSSSLGYIKHRLFAPIGFIPIERIFLCLSIKSNQPLHITCLYATLCRGRSSKIKSIPNIRSYQIRVFGDYPPLNFVKFSRECLRIKLRKVSSDFAYCLFLLVNIGLGTILRETTR